MLKMLPVTFINDYLNFFIAFLSILTLIFWYLKRNDNYWSKQGIKGPKPILLLGNFWDRIKYSQAHLDIKYLKQFGNIYGTFDGTEPVLQIAEPELIKQVLVKDFNRFNNRRKLRTEHSICDKNLFHSRDELWKRVRTITSSTFTSGKMKKLYGLVRICLNNYLKHLDKAAEERQDLRIKEMHENFTMDVIARCAFATQTNALKDPNDSFVVNLRELFSLNAFRVVPAFIFPKFVNNLLGINTFFNAEPNQWILSLSKHLVEKRRLSGEKNNDFLQLLVDAKEGDHKSGEHTEGLESHYVNKDEGDVKTETKNSMNKKLTEDEIMAQCWVFLLAGFETTATTLGYMSYILATNPECQQKLYNEVISAMDSDNEISYEKLHELPYLDACLSETLRLFPPVMRLEREVNQNFKLGDSEIRLFKGQLVEIPVYAIHHSEKFHKKANQFIPERFLKENRDQIIPYTYMPFGTGPRNCIGMRFALMEVKLTMAHMLYKYRLTKCDKTESEFEFKPLTPVLAAKSLTISIEKRLTSH